MICHYCNRPRDTRGPCPWCGRNAGLRRFVEPAWEEFWLAAAGLVAGIAEGVWGDD